MGYTHYFPHTAIDQKVWDKIVDDCKKLLAVNNIPLCRYGDDDDKPILDNNTICFNGYGDDGHETFSLNREGSNGFQFCKTARKFYDTLVCACLLVYVHHSPDTIELGSDGNADEWADGESIVREVLGYELSFDN